MQLNPIVLSSAVLALASVSVSALPAIANSAASAHPPIPNPASESAIPRLKTHPRPATTLKEWRTQLLSQTQTPVQVTGIRVDRTNTGIDITLEAADGKPLTIDATKFRSEGNSLIADIPNAVLALPSGQPFQAANPTADIAQISVTQATGNTLRITVTGTSALPKTDVVLKTGEFAYSLNPESNTDDEEVVVTGEGQRGYRVPRASTATKTNTPLRDVPANIQVIPRRVLEDQGAIRIDDALRNVSGLTFGNAFGGRISQFTGRGFAVTQFRNGLFEAGGSGALVGFNSRTSPEIADIEQIEVLKGPASVLFGQVEPGAMVNLVTKKPLFKPYYSTSFTAGSFNFYRPSIDFSDVMDAKGAVSYRLNMAIESAQSFRDFVETERLFIAPTIAWKISPKTTLSFEGSFLYDKRPIDRGLVALGTGVPKVPISRYLGPGTEKNIFDEKRGLFYLDHRFSDALSFRSTFRITKSIELRPLAVQAGNLRADNRTVPLSSNAIDQLYETYTWQNDLVAKFNTGTIKHTLLVGLDLNKIAGWNYNNFASGTRDVTTIDLFNLDYSRTRVPVLRPAPQNDRNYDVKLLGLYIQDQIDLSENFKLVVGGRYDGYEQDELRPSNINLSDRQKGSAFSPRVGLVYQPSKTISLYANYARSFQPQIGKSLDLESFIPERGTQYEVGIKADLIPNRLSATLAGYQITKSNVLTADPRDVNFSIQVGEQRSQGIELDLSGEILPGWNVIASYAYTDAEIRRDNRFPVGNRLINIPANTASLWTTYTLQSGSLKGLGFGAGVFFVDQRSGDLANSFEVPSYTRIDASISYQIGGVKASLNFKNLFDMVYYSGTQNRSSILPGSPFTVQGTLSYTF
jgi:iron complex outermembrane recepter protein